MLAEIVVGCVLGLALGGALIYGLVEMADWIVEYTHDFSTHR